MSLTRNKVDVNPGFMTPETQNNSIQPTTTNIQQPIQPATNIQEPINGQMVMIQLPNGQMQQVMLVGTVPSTNNTTAQQMNTQISNQIPQDS